MGFVWRVSVNAQLVGRELDVTCRHVRMRVRYARTVRVRETAWMDVVYVVQDTGEMIVV